MLWQKSSENSAQVDRFAVAELTVAAADCGSGSL